MSSPSPVSNPIVYGSVGGVPIAGNCIAGTLSVKQSVTLGATAYNRAPPLDYPRPDAGAPVSTSRLAYPQTIPGGTTITVFEDEAAALVAAGAAS
jgi:hypothetical protein